MYDYDEIYDQIIKKTETVNLPAEESIKIVNKIYNDLQIGLLKPRNITKRCYKLISNSISRQNGESDSVSIEKYQVETFIKNIQPRVNLGEEDVKDLKRRLLKLDEINSDSLNQVLMEYLEENNKDSLRMIKNQDFRKFDQAIVTIENPKLANRFGIYDENILLYSFIDHDEGIMFEILSEENNENHILTKAELENEIIRHLDKEEIDESKYGELRKLKIIDRFRNHDNPDIILVKFIRDGISEYLNIKLEYIIGSKLIGYLIDEPQYIKELNIGDEVVVSYCYDYTDHVHVYVNGDTEHLLKMIKEISVAFKNPSREIIKGILYSYRNEKEFDEIVDTFHSIIFDYFRDLDELYMEIDKEVGECI